MFQRGSSHQPDGFLDVSGFVSPQGLEPQMSRGEGHVEAGDRRGDDAMGNSPINNGFMQNGQVKVIIIIESLNG